MCGEVLKQMDVDGSKISDDKDPRKEALRVREDVGWRDRTSGLTLLSQEAWVLKKMNHPFIVKMTFAPLTHSMHASTLDILPRCLRNTPTENVYSYELRRLW